MHDHEAIEAFAALAQPNRLAVFRLLVKMEPGGLPVGEISRQLDIVPSTLSGHLAVLRRAGLVISLRQQREIHYRANLDGMGQLIHFMLDECCNGESATCVQVSDLLPDDARAGRSRKRETA